MTSVLTSGGKVKVRGGKVRVGAAGDPCCCDSYLQAHTCPDGTLGDVWMTAADATSIGDGQVFKLTSGFCGYFTLADTSSTSPGTTYAASDATATGSTDCASCVAPCTDCHTLTTGVATASGTPPFPDDGRHCTCCAASDGTFTLAKTNATTGSGSAFTPQWDGLTTGDWCGWWYTSTSTDPNLHCAYIFVVYVKSTGKYMVRLTAGGTIGGIGGVGGTDQFGFSNDDAPLSCVDGKIVGTVSLAVNDLPAAEGGCGALAGCATEADVTVVFS